MKACFDLTGHVFSRLKVIRQDWSDSRRGQYWFCECLCGNTAVVLANHLRKGKTTSCGCFGKEQRLASVLKHGQSQNYLYKTWKNHVYHIRSGTAGKIADRAYANMPIADRWNPAVVGDYAYLNFRIDVIHSIGERPDSFFTLDIIEHERGFMPGNIRWATKKEQAVNRRSFLKASPKQMLARISNEDLLAEVARRKL